MGGGCYLVVFFVLYMTMWEEWVGSGIGVDRYTLLSSFFFTLLSYSSSCLFRGKAFCFVFVLAVYRN